MSESLVSIRMLLSGAKKVAAEADAAAAGMAGVSAEAAKANTSIGKTGTALGGLKRSVPVMRSVGVGLSKYVTLPILAIGAASVDMGLKFQRSVLLLHTQAGVAKGELKGLEKSFLGITRATTFSPTEISGAAFRLAGAGLRGKALREGTLASAKLAEVGGANPEDTAKTIAQVWYQNIKGAGGFKHIIGELNATVGAGDLRLPQLVDALGTGVVASAKQAGLSMQDVNEALAVFGDSTNNVSGWAAQFATGLHYLDNPGEKATGAIKSIGLAQDSLAIDLHKHNGLNVALKDLYDHLNKLHGGVGGVKANQILGEILPGGRGRVYLNLLNNIVKLEEKRRDERKTTGNFGKAWKETQANPQVQLENAWSKTQAGLTELGTTLIPVLVPVLEDVAGGIESVTHAFDGLSPSTKKLVIEAALAAAALGPLLVIFTSLVGALITIANPITLTIAAVALMAVGFYVAYHKIKPFHDAVDFLVHLLGGAANAVGYFLFAFSPLGAVAVFVVNHLAAIRSAGEAIVTWFSTSPIGQALIHPFVLLVQYAKTAIETIEGVVSAAKEALELVGLAEGSGATPSKSLNEEISRNHPRHLPKPPSDIGSLPLPKHHKEATGSGYSRGGLTLVGELGPELVWMPRGAEVAPSNRTRRLMGPEPGAAAKWTPPRAGGGSRVTVPVIIKLGKKKVAEAVAEVEEDAKARL